MLTVECVNEIMNELVWRAFCKMHPVLAKMPNAVIKVYYMLTVLLAEKFPSYSVLDQDIMAVCYSYSMFKNDLVYSIEQDKSECTIAYTCGNANDCIDRLCVMKASKVLGTRQLSESRKPIAKYLTELLAYDDMSTICNRFNALVCMN